MKVKFEKKEFIINLVIVFIFVFLNYLYFTRNFVHVYEESLIKMKIISAIVAVVFLIVYCVINIFDIKDHNKFLIIACVLGIIYFLIIPFGNGNDELSHFLRIFEISEKYTTKGFVDDSMFPLEFNTINEYKYSTEIKYKDYLENFNKFNMVSGEKTNMNDFYWFIKVYAPIQYLPQVIGVTFGRLISDNLLVIGCLGRVFGFAFWLAICYIAIKQMPNRRLFFIILCLLPINIVSAICLSGDTVTNAIILLFIALIYKHIITKEKLTTKDKVFLFITSIVISLCKIIYLPFVFILLLLNKEHFKTKKEYLTFIIVALVISIIVGAGWFVIGLNVGAQNVNSKGQIMFILSDPVNFIVIVLRTLFSSLHKFILELTTGQELYCNMKVEVYGIISYLIGIIGLLSLFNENEKEQNELPTWKNVSVIAIILLTICLLIGAEYVQWTAIFEIGHFIVVGIQGRYLIPMCMMLILLNNKIYFKGIKNSFLINWIFVLQITMIYQTISYFL